MVIALAELLYLQNLLAQKNNEVIRYNPKTDHVEIATDFIHRFIIHQRIERQEPGYYQQRINSGELTPIRGTTNLTFDEHLLLLGVEEAFHSHQYKRKGGVIIDDNYSALPEAEKYQTAIEVEAGFAIKQAIQDLHLFAKVAGIYAQHDSFDETPYKEDPSPHICRVQSVEYCGHRDLVYLER